MEHVTQEEDLGVVIDTGGKQAAQGQAAMGRAKIGFSVVFGEGSFINQKSGC